MSPLPTVRPIILRASWILSARAGKRSHIILPATFVPKARIAVGAEAKAHQARDPGMRMPTPWSRLVPGDRLWVQEDVSCLIDGKNEGNNRCFYKVDLPGGHVPITGGVKGARYRTAGVLPHHMVREHSRYTLEVTGVRAFNAQDVSWDEMTAEGDWDGRQTKGAWWMHRYGVQMPWDENPPVVGLSFKFLTENIDGAMPAPDGPVVWDGKALKPGETARQEFARIMRDAEN